MTRSKKMNDVTIEIVATAHNEATIATSRSCSPSTTCVNARAPLASANAPVGYVLITKSNISPSPAIRVGVIHDQSAASA